MTELRTTESIRAAIAALTEQRQAELAKAADLKAKHAEQSARLHELTDKQRDAWANLPMLEAAAKTAAAAIEKRIGELGHEGIYAEARELRAKALGKVANRPNTDARLRELAARVIEEAAEIIGAEVAYNDGVEALYMDLASFESRHGHAPLASAGIDRSDNHMGHAVSIDGQTYQVQWIDDDYKLLSKYMEQLHLEREQEASNAAYAARMAELMEQRAAAQHAREAESRNYVAANFPKPSAAEREAEEQEIRGRALLNRSKREGGTEKFWAIGAAN